MLTVPGSGAELAGHDAAWPRVGGISVSMAFRILSRTHSTAGACVPVTVVRPVVVCCYRHALRRVRHMRPHLQLGLKLDDVPAAPGGQAPALIRDQTSSLQSVFQRRHATESALTMWTPGLLATGHRDPHTHVAPP